MDKFGPYIQKLMTTILDTEQEEFVINLAFSELKRLNIDVEEFLVEHYQIDDVVKEKSEKQLLQEDENVSNK